MDKINVNDDLPNDGQYVLAHLTKTNWGKDVGQYFKVVKFVKGLSIADRELLPDDDKRKKTYRSEDEYGNNLRGFYWDTHGANSFFGQEVDFWWYLPEEK